MNDDLKLYMKIKELMQNDMRSIATEVYNKLGTRYNVAKVPTHTHDGVDSVKIPPSGVQGFTVLPSTTYVTVASDDSNGVLSPINTFGQTISQGESTVSYLNNSNVAQSAFYEYPVVVIYGGGVGDTGTFNRGDAPVGTIIMFDHGGIAAQSGLQVKTANGWATFVPDSFS